MKKKDLTGMTLTKINVDLTNFQMSEVNEDLTLFGGKLLASNECLTFPQ